MRGGKAIYLLAALALAAAARGADAPPDFGESIDVRVVNLEAVVTDRGGQRVTGLGSGDFRLLVDGKEVPIEFFSEVKDGVALAAPAAGAKPEAGGAAVQGVAEGAVGTHYLVFIDDYFALAADRDAVLKGLKADLGRLGPYDRMAVVAYDGGRLAKLANWSGSPADLARAFDQAMARPPRGFDRLTELRSLVHDEEFASQRVRDGDPVDLSKFQTGLNNRQRIYADTLIRQVKGGVQAAVSAMRAFAAPEGRKVMLLLAGGWPFSASSFTFGVTAPNQELAVGKDPFGAPPTSGGANGLPTQELPEGVDVFGPLANTANLLGFTLYPVDVPGVQSTAADAEAPSPAGHPLGNLAEQEVEGALEFLAEKTGGKAILNSNRSLALANAREDTRSFYWLGFSPSWQHNDKVHDLKLLARRSDLRIRTRAGFLDLSQKAEVSMKVESALLFGNPPGALRMPMMVGAATRSPRGEVEVPLTLALPVDLMTVVQDGGKYTARLELSFAASDAAGNTTDVPTLPLTLNSDHAPAAGKFVRYDTKVKLRGQANHLVVAAYDPLSGKIATAEAAVKAP
jgi:VWFA-related protein